MKPKFRTRWRAGRLVVVDVEGGTNTEVKKELIDGLLTVVFVWVGEVLIYRDQAYTYVGPV